jgi:hypothetical protein
VRGDSFEASADRVNAPDAATALAGCEAALLLTDWPEFATLPWHALARSMRAALVLDTTGHLDPADLARAGLQLHTLGQATATRRQNSLISTGAVRGKEHVSHGSGERRRASPRPPCRADALTAAADGVVEARKLWTPAWPRCMPGGQFGKNSSLTVAATMVSYLPDNPIAATRLA